MVNDRWRICGVRRFTSIVVTLASLLPVAAGAQIESPVRTFPTGGRADSAMVWNPSGNVAYVFGGRSGVWNPFETTALFREVWRYEPLSGERTLLSDLPTVVCCLSAVWDARANPFPEGHPLVGRCSSGCAYLFGGYGEDYDAVTLEPNGLKKTLDKVVQFDPSSSQPFKVVALLPEGHAFTSTLFDNARAYIFFGWHQIQHGRLWDKWGNDVVAFDPIADTTSLAAGPKVLSKILKNSYDPIDCPPGTSAGCTSQAIHPRGFAAAVWDQLSGRGYLFGGLRYGHPDQPNNDAAGKNTVVVYDHVLRFNPCDTQVDGSCVANLTPLDIKMPEARFGSAAAWDQGRRVAYLFGGGTKGIDLSTLDTILTFYPDSPQVRRLCLTSPEHFERLPSPRERAAAAWDNSSSRVQMAGGYNYSSGAVNEILAFKATEPTSEPLAPSATAEPPGDVQVRWQPPPCDGGLPLTGYRIQRETTDLTGTSTIVAWEDITPSTPTQPCWPDTSLTDHNRSVGFAYRYRIAACNAVGASALWSNTARPAPDAQTIDTLARSALNQLCTIEPNVCSPFPICSPDGSSCIYDPFPICVEPPAGPRCIGTPPHAAPLSRFPDTVPGLAITCSDATRWPCEPEEEEFLCATFWTGPAPCPYREELH